MISICAAVYNNVDVVKKYIESLRETISQPYQLVLVDNNSNEETKDYLKQCIDRKLVHLVKFNKENEGLGKALSDAVDLAIGDYICITDVDIEFLTRNWDVEMCKLLNYEEVGLVGTFQNAGQTWLTRHSNYLESYVLTGCCTMTHRRIINYLRKMIDLNKNRLVDSITKLKSITEDEQYIKYLDKIHYFVCEVKNHVDPGYFYGVLDYDISALIRWLNYKLVIAENVKLNHNNTTTVVNVDEQYQQNRKKLTHDAWNLYRHKMELICDFHDWRGKWECYDSLPFNIDYRQNKKEFEINKGEVKNDY